MPHSANVWESIRLLSEDERNELGDYVHNLYDNVRDKFPHAHYCELETGLWDSCTCGVEEEREEALNKIRYIWLKKRGKYIEVIKEYKQNLG